MPRTLPLAALLTALGAVLPAGADDWPQWRGPGRDGVAPSTSSLEGAPRLLWSAEVGTGHSSPVVAGDHVYQFAREDDAEVLRALRLEDGSEVWRWSVETPYTRNPAAFFHGKGPKSTPVVAGDTVCALGISGRLSCLDRHSGTPRWSRHFEDRFDRSHPDFGTAASPVVVGGRLIAHVGGIERGALAAFDLDDGTEIWAWDGDAPAYASPVIATLSGVEQIITHSRERILALDPADGALLWSLRFTTPYSQNSVTPLVVGNTLVLSGLENPTFALAPTLDGRGNWILRKLWERSEVGMYMSSPVAIRDLIVGFTDSRKGQLFAVDAASGELLWLGEGRRGDNASLLVAGERLLVVTTESELEIGTPTREGWQADSTRSIADTPVWAHPALAGDRLLVKDETTLAAWELGS